MKLICKKNYATPKRSKIAGVLKKNYCENFRMQIFWLGLEFCA